MDAFGMVYILQAIQDVTMSIKRKDLNSFQRLRLVCRGGWFLLLQAHFAIFQNNYGSDHTFSRQSINAVCYLMIGLCLTMYRVQSSSNNRVFLPFQLQEYMIENFYGVARQHCGSSTNLNAENFLNALNNFLSALIIGLQFNKEKDQSTRLPYEYYCCFPSPEHINYIVIGEFERACRTFAMLSDTEYESNHSYSIV